MDKSKIGSAIQYFRESYNISQSALGMGLCSSSTLSRIEAGERDVDSLLLETLLERLGKTPNQFELVLSDLDFMLYQEREKIKKNISDKNIDEAYATLKTYEKIAGSKGSVHMQFIVSCKAYLNELRNGSVENTINLLMDAISYTIPDFQTNNIKSYNLSHSELNIIISIIEHMLSAKMFQKAEAILNQLIDYLDSYKSLEVCNQLFPRAAVIAAKLLMQNNKWEEVIKMCDMGLEKNKGSRRMDNLGELYSFKARATEELVYRKLLECDNTVIIKMYLQAYYVFIFCEDQDEAYKVRKHLQEVYQWENID